MEGRWNGRCKKHLWTKDREKRKVEVSQVQAYHTESLDHSTEGEQIYEGRKCCQVKFGISFIWDEWGTHRWQFARIWRKDKRHLGLCINMRVMRTWSQLKVGAVCIFPGKACNKGSWEALVVKCRQENKKYSMTLKINGQRNNWLTTSKWPQPPTTLVNLLNSKTMKAIKRQTTEQIIFNHYNICNVLKAYVYGEPR